MRLMVAALLAYCAASLPMPTIGHAQTLAAAVDRHDDLDALRASRRRIQAGLVDLLGSLDQRLRQLTDNDLTDLPPYTDLSMARHRIDRLAAETLPAIGDALDAAGAATGTARAALIDNARRRLAAVHQALLAEQFRFDTRRAHTAVVDDAAALLASLHTLRDRVSELTGDDEQGALEAIDAHAAVAARYDDVQKVIVALAARPDDLGALAAAAARHLRRSDIADALNDAMRDLRQARFAPAVDRIDYAIYAILVAANDLARHGGVGAYDAVDARDLERLSLRQQAIRDAPRDDAAYARLLAEQTTVQLELRRFLQRSIGDAATAALIDQAAKHAGEARQAMFRREALSAANHQRLALAAMRSLHDQLTDPAVTDAEALSSHDWRLRAAHLADAHARLRGLPANSPGLTEALRQIVDEPYLPTPAASRLAAALETPDALRHAVASVGEAQRRAHRRALAVSIGEHNRLAEALNLAAAAARRLDPPPQSADEATMFDNLHRIVRRASEVDPSTQPLADAARLLDQPLDAADAHSRLQQVARLLELGADAVRTDIVALAEQIDRDATSALDDALRLEQRLTELAAADRAADDEDVRRLTEQAFDVAPSVGAVLAQSVPAPRNALQRAAIFAQVHRQDLEAVRYLARQITTDARRQQQTAAAITTARESPEPPSDDRLLRAFAEALRGLGQSVAGLARQPLANNSALIDVLGLASSFDPSNPVGVRFIPRSPLTTAQWIAGRSAPSATPAVRLPSVAVTQGSWPDHSTGDAPPPTDAPPASPSADAVAAPSGLLNALPPSVREAMRTSPRSEPPRGYEQRLRYYFQNLD